MQLSRGNSLLSLSLVSAVMLTVGLTIAVVNLQDVQKLQDNRTYAAWTGGSCNLQGQSSYNCCKTDHIRARLSSWTDVAETGHKCIDVNTESCAGRRVPSNIWLCPGGNNIVCCAAIAAPQPPAPEPSVCGDTSAPTGTLLSQGADTDESDIWNDDPAYHSGKAVDGINDTQWNSGADDPQWIEINLGSKKTVSGLRLRVSQSPTGQTTHQIYTGPNPAPTTLSKTLNCETAAGQVINVVFPQPLTDTQYIRINTSSSPSWVAWFETEVYGNSGTSLDLKLAIHGIGKGEVNVSNSQWQGTEEPSTLPRSVNVEIYDVVSGNPGTEVVAEGEGQLAFANGEYTGTVSLSEVLEEKEYFVKVISGYAFKTEKFNLEEGENDIAMTLRNGDVNGDWAFTKADYDLIHNCVTDASVGREPTESQCSNTQKLKADIDNDGRPYWFDENIIVKEIMNQ